MLLVHISKGYTWGKKKVATITFEKLYEFASDKRMAE